jgi:hypothetical protein
MAENSQDQLGCSSQTGTVLALLPARDDLPRTAPPSWAPGRETDLSGKTEGS